MPVIESQLDTLSEDYAKNREAMQKAVDEFRSVENKVIEKSETNSTITISSPANYNIESWFTGRGIVRRTMSNLLLYPNGTTLQLGIRDVDVNEDITFYLTAGDGLTTEWDFEPFDQWYTNNLFWSDQTAPITLRFFDRGGSPLPDGLKVTMSVDEDPRTPVETDDEKKPNVAIVRKFNIISFNFSIL